MGRMICNVKDHFESKNCDGKKYMENNALFKGKKLGRLSSEMVNKKVSFFL